MVGATSFNAIANDSEIFLCFAGLAFFRLTEASAQDTIRRWSRPNVLKTNVLAPISIFYERALTPRFALRISARGFKISRELFDDQSFANATLEGKIYTGKLSRLRARAHPTGFFVNPYLKARSMRYVARVNYGFNKEGDRDEIQVNSIGVGLTVGYQWVSRRGLVVEIFHGGGGFPFNQIRHIMRYGTVVSGVNDYLSLDLRSGVSLGYAF